jgi:hypothetical protein
MSTIAMSDPYDPETTNLNLIVRYKGNTSNITLESTHPVTRFATLLITGNQALDKATLIQGNGTGATVAEWSILGPDGAIVPPNLPPVLPPPGDNPSESQKLKPRRLKLRGVVWDDDM